MIIVIPAAGIGSRFSATIPKQYCLLGEQSILGLTISRFLADSLVKQVWIALADDDPYFVKLGFTDNRLHTCRGGATRAESVLNALLVVKQSGVRDNELIGIHDAVRPVFEQSLLANLHQQALLNPAGAIAAVAATDTVKISGRMCDDKFTSEAEVAEVIEKTIDRSAIWLAQTPQVFQLQTILSAYQQAKNQGKLSELTDEASAIELFGIGKPSLVQSSRYNIKITLPEDLSLAELIYQQMLQRETV
jgi:2-C-methyl-D-erythritol 4-phosphate cytidylyltransferase